MKLTRLALLGLAGRAAAQDVITDDSHFYGLSPPVYPSPQMDGRGDWAEAYQKATALVSQMTLEEKVNMTGGVPPQSGCSGVIPPLARLGFPGLCLTDAGNGVRHTDLVSSWPSGNSVGASWNKALARARGVGMGGEFHRKGVNVLLGPVVGPMGRSPLGGRNWEGFSTDPVLTGALVGPTVQGIQQTGVITSTKHYIGNEQETNRNPSGNISSVSSNIDDKTMHELYLWPFVDAVHAGTGNIMCSYERINNSYGCSNSKTLNGLLKTELGYQGWVVTDWGALHAGVATAEAGLDMAMPSGSSFWGDHLVEAVQNGTLPESRLTDMVIRIMTSWYRFNQDVLFPNPGIGMPLNPLQPHDAVDARDPAARPILHQGALEGHVLVKNTNNALPLKNPRMLSLFGYSAITPINFAPSNDSSINSLWTSGGEALGVAGTLSARQANGTKPAIGPNGTLFGGCGSGANTPALAISPYEAIKMRAFADGTALFGDFLTSEPVADPLSDACIVFANAWGCEGYDRPALSDEYTDTLIRAVADSCANTIVVFHNAGVRLVDGFVDHPNVTAILYAHLPGEMSGPALVEILYGDANPSGKLPYTVAKLDTDYGDVLHPALPEGQFVNFPQADFSEGVLIDYRHFDAKNITPRYEFGFGLSYTTFQLGDLAVEAVPGADRSEFPSGPILDGGATDLWDGIVTVRFSVRNTGAVAGAEVAQLYVGIPGAEAAKQLRGFEKVYLLPGQTTVVTMEVNRRELSVWDVEAQRWRLQSGEYSFWVGNSSRNLPLQAQWELSSC